MELLKKLTYHTPDGHPISSPKLRPVLSSEQKEKYHQEFTQALPEIAYLFPKLTGYLTQRLKKTGLYQGSLLSEILTPLDRLAAQLEFALEEKNKP
jgi:hypothetical protein